MTGLRITELQSLLSFVTITMCGEEDFKKKILKLILAN